MPLAPTPEVLIAPPSVVTLTTPPPPALDVPPPKENKPIEPPPLPAKPPTDWAKMPMALLAWVVIVELVSTVTEPPLDEAAPLPPTLMALPPADPPSPPDPPMLCAQMPAAPTPDVLMSNVF